MLPLMGVPMDSIHAPTVHSEPTSGPAVDTGPDIHRLPLFELIAQRDIVEQEIRALSDVLDSVCDTILRFVYPGEDSN